MQHAQPTHRGFVRLVAGAAVVTFLMITIGAVTRVTESGMGCGPYWPSCNGHLIPEFYDITVVIEYGHRLFALLVGLFAAGAAWQAFRRYRAEPRIFNPIMAGCALFFVQSGIGALTVAVYNQWVSVMLHLGTAMCLFAAFVVAWVNARAILLAPAAPPESPPARRVILPPAEVMLATALAFIVAMVGAVVAGTNATKACVGWPLCGGEVLPVGQGPLQVIHMLHRLVAGALGVLLVVMLAQSWRGVNRQMRAALALALGVYFLQAALGASIVLLDNREWTVAARALHVTFAATTWALMVAGSAIAWLQLSPVRGTATPRPSPMGAAASATTSNSPNPGSSFS
jgi:heme A synthase